MPTNNLEKIVYLTEAQKQTLFTNGSITVEGQTVVYSDNDIYFTTDGVLPASGGGTGLSTIGTSGQFLRVNSTGSGLEWANGNAGTVTSVRIQATSPV